MKSTNWKPVVEVVGISAVVASLIFVGIQLRQSQEIAIAETFLSILTSELETLNSANEYAEIWTKANSGAELTDVEATVFANLVEGLHLRNARARSQLNRLGHTDAADLRAADFASFLYRNPEARKVWDRQVKVRDQHRALTNGFIAPFTGEVRAYLRELDQIPK